MSQFEIVEVAAYRAADGGIALVSDLQSFPAYKIETGALYESRDAARQVLIGSAIHAVGSASPEIVSAAAQNANTDEANLARYAILYLAAVMKGEA
jgi:hypothetical protein